MTVNRFAALVSYGRYEKVCLKLLWVRVLTAFYRVLQLWSYHVLGSIFIMIVVVSYAIPLELFFIKIGYMEIQNRWKIVQDDSAIKVLLKFPSLINICISVPWGWDTKNTTNPLALQNGSRSARICENCAGRRCNASIKVGVRIGWQIDGCARPCVRSWKGQELRNFTSSRYSFWDDPYPWVPYFEGRAIRKHSILPLKEWHISV